MQPIAFVMASLALGLAACATGAVETVSASSDGVTVRHPAGYESSASQQAQAQCQNYAKKARLRSSHDEGGRRFAIYDCVPM